MSPAGPIERFVHRRPLAALGTVVVVASVGLAGAGLAAANPALFVTAAALWMVGAAAIAVDEFRRAWSSDPPLSDEERRQLDRLLESIPDDPDAGGRR